MTIAAFWLWLLTCKVGNYQDGKECWLPTIAVIRKYWTITGMADDNHASLFSKTWVRRGQGCRKDCVNKSKHGDCFCMSAGQAALIPLNWISSAWLTPVAMLCYSQPFDPHPPNTWPHSCQSKCGKMLKLYISISNEHVCTYHINSSTKYIRDWIINWLFITI